MFRLHKKIFKEKNFVAGGTNTHLPLKTARESMFTYRYGDRPDVPNLAIILTDGQTNDAQELTQQAQMVCQSYLACFLLELVLAEYG